MSWNQKKLCVGVWEFHEALCIPDALSKYSLSLWCFLPLICTFQEDLVPSLLLGKSSPWVLLPCICSPSEPFLRFALDSDSATSKPCCVRDGCGCQGGSSAGSRAVYPPVPHGHMELGRCLGGPGSTGRGEVNSRL